MRIDDSGNVGIGLATPGALLHLNQSNAIASQSLSVAGMSLVVDAPSPDVLLRKTAGANQARLSFGEPGGISSSISDTSKVLSYGSEAHKFYGPGGLPLLFLNGNGSVGVGTTTPGARLEINDADANAATSGLKFTNFACAGTDKLTADANGVVVCAPDAAGSGTGNIIDTLGDTLAAGTEAGGRNIVGVANFGVGTSAPARQVHIFRSVGNPGLRIETDQPAQASIFEIGRTGALWSIATTGAAQDDFAISDSVTSRLYIKPGGNIGIGTSNPAAKLQVEGETRAQFFTNLGRIGADPTHLNNARNVFVQDNGAATARGVGWIAAAFGNTGGNRVVIGQSGGRAEIAGHSSDLNAWTDLILNPEGGGNVGIGSTAAPTAKLTVAGVVESKNGGFKFPDGTTQTTAASGGSSQWTTSGSNIYYNAGNVGIGTASPAQKLEITNGNIVLNRLAAGIASYYVGTGGAGGAIIPNATGGAQIEFETFTDGGDGSQAIHFLTHHTGVSHARRMTIDKRGNVGIGTASPAYKLDLVGTSGSPLTLLRLHNTAELQNYGAGVALQVGDYTKIHSLRGPTGSSLVFHTWNETTMTEKMRIQGSGNVGIGTDNPSYKLDVNGVINATALYTNGIPFSGSQWTTSGSNVTFAAGNVGIGTTVASTRLTLPQGAAVKVGNAYISGPSNSSGFFASNLWSDGASYYAPDPLQKSAVIELAGDELTFYQTPTAGSTALNDKLVIKSGGNVGIGTFNPAYKLQVNGQISGTQLCIAADCKTAWPSGGSSQWTTAGSNIYYNSGSVGIGTAAPGQALHVGSGNILLPQSSGDATGNLFLGGIPTLGQWSMRLGMNTSSQALFDVRTYSTGDALLFRVDNTNGTTTRMLIRADGNVGIGTFNPGQRLSVAGTVESTSGGFRFPDGSVQTTAAGGAASQWTTAGSDIYYNSGRVAIGTTAPAAKLHAAGTDTSIALWASDNAGAWIQNTNTTNGTYANLSFVTKDLGAANVPGAGIAAVFNNHNPGGVAGDLVLASRPSGAGLTERLRINSAGNIGIGTAAPTSGFKLDVRGAIWQQGNPGIYVSPDGVVYGTIATDGTGNLSLSGYLPASKGILLAPYGGYVGVGTTSPAYQFHVADTLGVGSRMAMKASQLGYPSAPWKVLILGSTGSTQPTDAVTLSLGYDPSANQGYTIGNGSEVLTRNFLVFAQAVASGSGYLDTLALNNGSVGIGTKYPAAGTKLDVAGAVNVGGTLTLKSDGGNTGELKVGYAASAPAGYYAVYAP